MSRDLAETSARTRTGPTPPAAGARWFWWGCALGAAPIAAVVVVAGYPMETANPPRDLAMLTLWSVLEEIVFRGLLQPAMARAFERRQMPMGGSPLTLANVATSVLFASVHLWRHPLAVALGVFPISLIYGKARELSGHWWPAALLHVGFNVALYAASWLLAGGR
jgi:membrane protease YdiL (CAAX protease family)